ncbi:hypothetical protein D3C76_1273880 [compost metagenome]
MLGVKGPDDSHAPGRSRGTTGNNQKCSGNGGDDGQDAHRRFLTGFLISVEPVRNFALPPAGGRAEKDYIKTTATSVTTLRMAASP